METDYDNQDDGCLILDDSKLDRYKEKRAKELGFSPQRECLYNMHLPYEQKVLDEESKNALNSIKNNLPQAVLAKEFEPSIFHWARNLTKYINLYGYKFSKDEHVLFIELFLGLLKTKDLETRTVQKIVEYLTTLLKRPKLLTPDDITIDWRPLYELVERIVHSKDELHGLEYNPPLDKELWNLVALCRNYFPQSATKEMLDEWRPMLCPFDVTVVKALKYFEVFLPTVACSEEERKNSWQLWFDEFYAFWDSIHNGTQWEEHLIKLLTRVAHDNIGFIDWKPYSSTILTRLLRLFRLPVGKQHHTAKINTALLNEPTAKWFISMLGGDTTKQVLLQLKSLLKTIELYYHPSNNGRWTPNLLTFMSNLSRTFVNRIRRERYRNKRHDWRPQIPKSHMLSNDDITEFVKIMLPITYLGMYSKHGSNNAAKTVQMLATLRPELVVPTIIERTHVALDTLTEPHQLKSCLSVLTFAIRPMMVSHKYYPEGRIQLIEILTRLLPTIDSNDVPKCMVAFQFMSSCFHQMRIEDCSKLVSTHPELSEQEKDLCHATARLEDFVVQFMDRCFHFIESLNHENDTRGHSSMESVAILVILTTVYILMSQCSQEIYKLCLNKIYTFATTHLFVGKSAVNGTSGLCRALLIANPDDTAAKFIPTLCQNILDVFLDNPDVIYDEKPDKVLQLNLSILTEFIRTCGMQIVKYKSELFEVCEKCLSLTAVESYGKAAILVQGLIKSLTSFYEDKPNDGTIEGHLSINDWGKMITIYDLEFTWHVPQKEEIEVATELIKKFLMSRVEMLEDFAAEKQTMTKEELLRCLTIVHTVTKAAKVLMPFSTNKIIELNHRTNLPITSWEVPTIELNPAYHSEERQQMRSRLFKAVRSTLWHVIEKREDDVKAILHVMHIYSEILDFNEQLKNEFNRNKTMLTEGSSLITDPLLGNKRQLKPLLLQRTLLQNSLRLAVLKRFDFTETHDLIFKDLVKLSMSHYMQIRSNAQNTFFRGISIHPQAHERYFDEIISIVEKGPKDNHKAYKGAMYLMLGGRGKKLSSIACKHRWDVLARAWPAIIKSPHTDKISVGKLYEKMAEKIQTSYNSISIEERFSDDSAEPAKKLLKSLSNPQLNEAVINKANDTLKSKSEQNLILYQTLVRDLHQLIKNGTLSWRNTEFASGMLMLMLRKDAELNPDVVKMFVENLTANTLSARDMATVACHSIFCRLKRRHKVVQRSVENISGITPSKDLNPGDRADNQWHRYDSNNLLDTKEKFESTVFIDKTHWGYYQWPKTLKTYAKFEEQPKLDRTRDELNDSEAIIFDKFSDSEYVEKLIEYNSLENVKGKDTLCIKRVDMFVGLFKTFGDTFINVFRPIIERLSVDTQESNQRCLAEVLTGIIVGSKHWGFDKLNLLWSWVIPVFSNVFANISVEMLKDWDNAFAVMIQNRDPRRLHWFIEFLMKDVLAGNRSSFGDSSHLYLLQSGLHQQEWRANDILKRLLVIVEDKLDHQYKNIREKVGSVLASLFFYDIDLCNIPHLRLAPNRGDFIQRVLLKVSDLMTDDVATVITTQSTSTASSSRNPIELASASLMDPQSVMIKAKQMIHDVSTGDETMMGLDPNDIFEKFEMFSAETPEAIRNAVMAQMKNLKVLPDNDKTEDAEIEEEFHSLVANDNHSKQVRVLKTIMKWIICAQKSTMQPFIPEMLKILPMICKMSPVDTASSDEELNRDTQLSLAYLAQSYVPKRYLGSVVEAVEQISESSSWHARYTVLTYVQAFVFNNVLTLQDNTNLEHRLFDVLLKLLQDNRLEVREMSSTTLGGLMQCGFFTISEKVNNFITNKCKVRIRHKRKREEYESEELQRRIVERHAGVLAICSCLMSAPYDVPEWVPDLVMRLSDHLHDPQPIEATVKKAVSEFKRTHHDSWHVEKLKFTSDQLSVLSDLLVSPSYYA